MLIVNNENMFDLKRYYKFLRYSAHFILYYIDSHIVLFHDKRHTK